MAVRLAILNEEPLARGVIVKSDRFAMPPAANSVIRDKHANASWQMGIC